MDEQRFEAAVGMLEAIAEAFEAAKPQTMEEWEEAYRELWERYQRLREVAEEVDAVAMAPGICKPTWKGEDGTFRKIVATRTLERMREQLWED